MKTDLNDELLDMTREKTLRTPILQEIDPRLKPNERKEMPRRVKVHKNTNQ